MTLLKKSTVIAAALTLLASPALAQAETPPAGAPTQDQGAAQPHDMSGQGTDAMREMMREMMMQMMKGQHGEDGQRGARAERRNDERWHHGRRLDRKMRDGRGMRGDRGDMRSNMMHGAGMRMVFAIVDGDGDGALSLAEVQDFHGRIFKAVDQNKDGRVEMTEIQTFFHGSTNDNEE